MNKSRDHSGTRKLAEVREETRDEFFTMCGYKIEGPTLCSKPRLPYSYGPTSFRFDRRVVLC